MPYGYKSTAEPGVIAIDDKKADVVRKIFQMYADGYSPRAIAGSLNAEGVPSPRGGKWNASTINGHRSRGVGILRNTIYVGQRVWRRTCKVRNPDTGQKLIRAQNKEKQISVEVPHLRILKKELWSSVQTRLPNRTNAKPYPTRRAYLLSGLMECGECGSSYTAMGGGKYIKFGCSARRESSTCTNRRLISRSIVDNCVLVAIEEHLLQENCIGPAVHTLKQEYKRLEGKTERLRPKTEKRLLDIQRAKRDLLLLLESGVEPEAIRDRLLELDQEERSKKEILAEVPKLPTIDVDRAVAAYREVVGGVLEQTLEDNYMYKQEIKNAIRRLVDKVVIYPHGDPQGRDLELVGDIEELCLPTAVGMKAMVPGGGIEPPTRGFSIHCSTPELPGHRNDVCRWVEAFYDVLQAVSRGFFRFFSMRAIWCFFFCGNIDIQILWIVGRQGVRAIQPLGQVQIRTAF